MADELVLGLIEMILLTVYFEWEIHYLGNLQGIVSTFWVFLKQITDHIATSKGSKSMIQPVKKKK